MRGRMSRLAGLSLRYVSRGPGAVASARARSGGGRAGAHGRGRRCCSGSTRLRYRRDTAGALDPVIGAVAGVSRSSGFAPALPVRSVAGSAVGFPDVSIGRRIAVIAGAGGRAGNRFRLRGRSGVPWGAVRGPGVPGWCGRGASVP